MIKKYFLTGLAILLPIVITIWILSLLIRLLTAPFTGIIESIFQYYNLFNVSFLWLDEDQVIALISKVFVLLFLIGSITLIGFCGKWFLLRWLGYFGNYILH